MLKHEYTMNYCGIKRPGFASVGSNGNPFNKRGAIYEDLGDKILKSIEVGADLGSPESVKYDEKDQKGVDVLTDPNHDFFDIAEDYGEVIAKSVGSAYADPAPSLTEGPQADLNPTPVEE